MFIWFFSDVSDKLKCLSHSEITCYVMLATYLGKEGYLTRTRKKPLTKSDLKDVLDVSKSNFYKLYNKLVMYSLIWDKDDKIYINPDIFFTGELPKSKPTNEYVFRLYTTPFRDLYANHKNHIVIGKLLTLTEHINMYHNVLCEDTYEMELKKSKPLAIKDVCSHLGITDTNSSRLSRELASLKFKNGMTAVNIKKNGRQKEIFINPLLMFAGANQEKALTVGGFV